MAKTLSCDYTMDLPNFEHISPHGKDFISKLLVLDPKVHITTARIKPCSASDLLLCLICYMWILKLYPQNVKSKTATLQLKMTIKIFIYLIFPRIAPHPECNKCYTFFRHLLTNLEQCLLFFLSSFCLNNFARAELSYYILNSRVSDKIIAIYGPVQNNNCN